MAIQIDRLLIAVLIMVVATAVIGVTWGFVGMLFFLTAEVTAEAFYASPMAVICGFAFSLLPIVVGVAYLTPRVDEHEYAHCAIFGSISILISLTFLFFGDDPVVWTDIAYYLVVIPVALASCWLVKRMTRAG